MADGQERVDLKARYRLGDCEIDPGTGDIRAHGTLTRLPPMAIEVLGCLAARPGQLVTRDEIERAVWQGRTVGYDSLTGLMFKLRKALGDDTKAPVFIETIPKKGYRLLVAPEPAMPAAEDRAARARPRRARQTALVALVLLASVAGAFVLTRPDPAPVAGAGAPITLAIIPFATSGPDGDDGYLASGITDDLATSFTKDARLLLIAPESAGQYDGTGLPEAEIARRLGVGHLLRGTVRSMGDGLRINARLVRFPSGEQVWADAYAGDLEELFEIERRIIADVTASLSGQAADVDLHVHTSDPRAYKAFQLGRESFYLFINKAANAQARILFAEALEIDPEFTMARVMLAWTHAFDAMNGWAVDRDAALKRAEREANAAIAADPDIPLSYFITGLVFRERHEYVKAMAEAQKAIELDPYFPNAHVLLATLLYYAGRPEDAVAPLKRAMALNPHHPFNYEYHLGQAYFVMGDYTAAIEVLNRGIDSNPADERLHVWLAASYARAGQQDDAAWEVEQVMTLNPGFDLSAIGTAYPFKYQTDHDNFVAALKLAGFS